MGCARGAHGKTAPRLTKRLTIPHRMVIRHLDGCPGESGVSPLYGSAGIATADAPVHGESPSGRRIAANTARTTPRTIPSAILSAVDKSAKTGLTCFRKFPRAGGSQLAATAAFFFLMIRRPPRSTHIAIVDAPLFKLLKSLSRKTALPSRPDFGILLPFSRLGCQIPTFE